MKRVIALSLSVLVVGCADTPTRPDMEVEPSFAAGGGGGVDAVGGRIAFQGETEDDVGIFSVHARGLSADARGTVTLETWDGAKHKYDVVGLNVDFNGATETGVASILTREGLHFQVRQWVHEKFFTPVWSVSWNYDGCRTEICELPAPAGTYGASKGKVRLSDGIPQETLPW